MHCGVPAAATAQKRIGQHSTRGLRTVTTPPLVSAPLAYSCWPRHRQHTFIQAISRLLYTYTQSLSSFCLFVVHAFIYDPLPLSHTSYTSMEHDHTPLYDNTSTFFFHRVPNYIYLNVYFSFSLALLDNLPGSFTSLLISFLFFFSHHRRARRTFSSSPRSTTTTHDQRSVYYYYFITLYNCKH